jgi:hypothetical protein
MPVFVMRNGRLVDRARAAPLHTANEAVQVIRDEMDATRHMATGEYFTSKQKFRQRTRDVGCVEVGDQTETLLRPRKPITLSRAGRREAIRSAIRQLREHA